MPIGQYAGMQGIEQGGNFLGTMFNRIFRRKDIRQGVDTQKELQNYAFDKNMEAWKMQNEYNSPLQQMSRLKEAGLNPNMIYGTGSAVGNTTGGAPKMNMPGVNTDKPGLKDLDVIGAHQRIRMNEAQIKQVDANTAFIDAKKANEGVKTILNQLGVDYAEGTLEGRISINSQQLANLEADRSIKEQVRLKAMQDAITARFQAQLSEYGLTSADNVVVRALAMASLQQGLSAEEFHGLLKSGWNKFWDRLGGNGVPNLEDFKENGYLKLR